jgi:hypothetical protein
MNAKTTRKADSDELEGDLLPEYRFDYSTAHPNRFAALANAEPLVVRVDDDIAEVFSTPEAVNRALRAILQAFPDERKKAA